MTAPKAKIHLDTDLGGDIDDLCALALLLATPDVEITGITTVAEEGGRRCGYVRYVLRLAGREDIPVAAGADVSSGCYRFPIGYPDDAAYWPEPIVRSPNPPEEALDLLARSVETGATVVAIGPYTNLAWLDRTRPGLPDVGPLYLMGFQVRPAPPGFPRLNLADDYNIQIDVAAARQVLEAHSPTIIPCEMTVQTALRRSHLAGLREAGPLGDLIARQAEAFARDYHNEETYGRTYPGLPDDIINFLHDPVACAVALDWDGARIETLPLRPELTGDNYLRATITADGKPTPVVTAVDGEGFSEWWFNRVTRKG